MKLGHQVRAVPNAIIGWDFPAAFALADAMGLSRPVLAELLPEIEDVAMQRINEQMREEA